MFTQYGIYANTGPSGTPGNRDDAHTVLHPRLYKPDGDPPVLFAHGFGGLASHFLVDAPDLGAIAHRLAEAGFAVAGSDDGTNTFGNGTAVSLMTAKRAFMADKFGTDPDEVFLIGASMGTQLCCNWARENLASVKAIALLLGPADFEAIQNTNRGGHTVNINNAYGGAAGWEFSRPVRNPIEYAEQLDGIPIKCWYGTIDALVLPSEVEAFAALCGAELRPLTGIGHTTATIDADEIVEFFEANA